MRDGIILIKLWLTVGREMPRWKLAHVDIIGLTKWEEYNIARGDIFSFTHSDAAPWTGVRVNDKRRTPLNAIEFFATR